MSEQLVDLAWTTVAVGGYTNGSGVLNVGSTSVGSGALPFPASGVFSVSIADPVTFIVHAVLTVTGINSATQFAVTSGGLDVACAAGDLVEAVQTRRSMIAFVEGPAWVGLSGLYVNSWTDNGGGYQVGQYTKDGTGRVWLRGVLKGGTVTAGTTLFTLPSGFRPPTLNEYIALGIIGAANVIVPIDILANGNVVLQLTLSASSPLLISGISFSVN